VRTVLQTVAQKLQTYYIYPRSPISATAELLYKRSPKKHKQPNGDQNSACHQQRQR